MVAVRFVLFLTLCAAAGAPAALLLLTPRAGDDLPRGASAMFRLAPLVAMLASIVFLPLLAAEMAGAPGWPIDVDAVRTVLSDTTVGAAWIVRVTALAIAIGGGTKDSRRGAAVSGAGSTIALATLAWDGHGVSGEGVAGWVHLFADIAHLLASGLWIGALLAFAAMLLPKTVSVRDERLGLACHALIRFASIGTVTVTVLILTGIVNSWFLIGPDQVETLGASLWGRLLLIKLSLFGVMLALAGFNRWRYVPALRRSIDGRDHGSALGVLCYSLLAEIACALIVLIFVAWLGTLEPPKAG